MESDFNRIQKECLSKGILWEDPDFLAIDSNIFYHHKPPGVQFQWKRPHELVESPQFVIDDLKKFDIVPGNFGQSWFVSALRVMIQYRALFYRAVPADQDFPSSFSYAGIFHFRFWFGKEWIEVLVDDRLPTVNGELAFVQSESNKQFWAPLLEKAYAKLHKNYEGVGYTSGGEILSELSGGVTEFLPIPQTPSNKREWLKTLRSSLSLTVISTAISHSNNPHKNGILPRINYGIIAVDKVIENDGSDSELIRLRLPPALPPFSGIYSNSETKEWKRIKDWNGLDPVKEMNHGNFWMGIEEFEDTFDGLEMVHLDKETCNPEETFLRLNAKPLHMRSFQGKWGKGSTAGGCRNHTNTFHINPQLMLRVEEGGDFILALIQQSPHQHSVVIGFSIYRFEGESRESTLGENFFKTTKARSHSSYSNSKQIVKRMYLETGNFVIVPTTYAVGQEASFTFRVYGQKPIYLWALDNVPSVKKQPFVKSSKGFDKKYEDLFLSHADHSKTVNCYELQELLHGCLPNDYMKSSASLDVCRKAIQAFSQSHSHPGRLSLNQFRSFFCSLKIWAKIFESYSVGSSGVMKGECLKDALMDVGLELSCENIQSLIIRYMRQDGTLRFGDFVAAILHLISIFNVASRHNLSKKGYTVSEWMKAALRCG